MEHLKGDPDNPDLIFEHAGKKVLVEVHGTKKLGPKSKVLQLEGWITREIDKGLKEGQVQGIYAINHYREQEPNKRNSPLSDHAVEFMKRYKFILITTPRLFSIVKEVTEGGISKKEARAKVWEGESIE